MKADLDALMRTENVDAMMILGNAQHNPAMVYMTGGGHILNAILIKKTGTTPVLFHGPMERDEAARTGLQTISLAKYPLSGFLKEANGDRILAQAIRLKQILADAGVVKGKVALYGLVELSKTYHDLSRLEAISELSFDGDLSGQVLQKAASTKDLNEIERIRNMAKITAQVVGNTADFLSSLPVEHGKLMKSADTPLTIGDVKKRINLWLAEAGAENPEGTIFAIGKDAGVPHSSGTSADLVETGKTIVFDIFPCEPGGGYYYDFTRTWCLGEAPDEVIKVYQQVMDVYQKITTSLEVGALFSVYQTKTCDYYEEMGHPTLRNHPEAEVGYVHSIGHGLGLNVHEKPFSGSTAGTDETLVPGSVFTIEPGLYYPEKGFGVRIEDSFWVTSDNRFEKFVDYSYDLIIPVKRTVS
jgi:Xaa-Pro aminopeptidase